MPNVTWILVADRSRAMLLHALPNGLGPYPTLASYVHVEGRLRPQDRDSDAGGSLSLHGGARSTVEPHDARWLVEARVFAREIAAALDQDRLQNRFDRLIVIAPPPFLGVLRDTWPPLVRERIAAEIGTDLLPMTDTTRQERLEAIVAETDARLPATV